MTEKYNSMKCPKCGELFFKLREALEHTTCGVTLEYHYEEEKRTPKMLFVDDRSKRIHWALENYSKEYEVTIATCVPEALRLLCSQPWNVVSLDHDLNGYDFQDPETPTCGMEIVRYIQKCGGWPEQHFGTGYNNPILHKPEFWIHSKNIFASHLMIVSLQDMDLKAFHKPVIYKTENIQYDEKGIPK